MAQAVEQALEEKRHLIVEAGTGTGKTLAYLLPVIRSGKRVIVSTGTKNLQEQLFFKDLPFLEQALFAEQRIPPAGRNDKNLSSRHAAIQPRFLFARQFPEHPSPDRAGLAARLRRCGRLVGLMHIVLHGSLLIWRSEEILPFGRGSVLEFIGELSELLWS